MKTFLSIAFILACFSSTAQKKVSGTTRQKTPNKPFVIGEIQEIYSKILGEPRILNIYLPEDYHSSDTSHYPVVYLLDGSANEDFIHVSGLYQFHSFSWINNVPKSIVVGIANVNRKRDFTFPCKNIAEQKKYAGTSHSEAFINFIEKELQPYIENQYRTSAPRTIIGQSLGGLLATEILFKKPRLFNDYIIISPSLWWDNGSLLNMKDIPVLQKDWLRPLKIYIGVGKEGLTPGDQPHVMEVDANMLAEKLKTNESKQLDIYFDYLPQEDHGTIGHQAVFNALRHLYPIKKEKNQINPR